MCCGDGGGSGDGSSYCGCDGGGGGDEGVGDGCVGGVGSGVVVAMVVVVW